MSMTIRHLSKIYLALEINEINDCLKRQQLNLLFKPIFFQKIVPKIMSNLIHKPLGSKFVSGPIETILPCNVTTKN